MVLCPAMHDFSHLEQVGGDPFVDGIGGHGSPACVVTSLVPGLARWCGGLVISIGLSLIAHGPELGSSGSTKAIAPIVAGMFDLVRSLQARRHYQGHRA